MKTSPLPTAAELRDELRSRLFRHYAPPATTVLGFRLVPFSLWHWRTLDLLQSPFAPDSLADSWSDEDVALAARICALPVGGDAFHIGRFERLRLIYRTRRFAALLPFHAGVLQSHITDALAGPAQWHRTDSVGVRCPSWLYLVAALVSSGWTEAEAWAKTPGEARCLLGAVGVAKGGSDFIDERDVLTALDSGYTLEDIGLV